MRSLWFYRVVTLVLLACVAALSAIAMQAEQAERRSPASSDTLRADTAASPQATVPEASPTRVALIDLEQHSEVVKRGNEALSDFSISLFHSDRATIHLHVLAPGQTIPFHIHRASVEAVVVITGAPRISQVVRASGAPVRRDAVTAPGSLVSSPILCAHQWRNVDQDVWQSNLVFASPRFDGNLFLSEDDPRITSPGPSLVIDPDALAAEPENAEPFVSRAVATLPEQLSTAVIRDRMPLTVTEKDPALVYVARGTGSLHADGERALRPQHLAVLSGTLDAELRSDAGQSLVAYVFRPQRGGSP